jgi:hypothetical protein
MIEHVCQGQIVRADPTCSETRASQSPPYVIQAGGQPSHQPDAKLIAVLADSQRWISDLTEGRAASVRDLARQRNRDVADVSRTLPLAYLEPAIVEAILDARQPIGLTPRTLKRIGMLPRS